MNKELNAAEAVYGFVGWLTSREERTVMSAKDDCAPIAELIKRFCTENNLPEVSDQWPLNLIHPSGEVAVPNAVLAKWGTPAPVAAAPDMTDAYAGAREDLSIWKKRALEAEALNRKFAASVNSPSFMGEPAALARAGEYPPLVCDYCGALTPDPWHSSGMMNGKMSKHIHSCDACAARVVAQASPAPSASIEQEAMQMLWNDQQQEEKEHYRNVARGAERIK